MAMVERATTMKWEFHAVRRRDETFGGRAAKLVSRRSDWPPPEEGSLLHRPGGTRGLQSSEAFGVLRLFKSVDNRKNK